MINDKWLMKLINYCHTNLTTSKIPQGGGRAENVLMFGTSGFAISKSRSYNRSYNPVSG